MTRKIDKEKYERILKRLTNGETQKSIVIDEKCSYGTISAAKQWDKMGRPTTITTTKNTSTNRTKIVVSMPNFWLERLNEDIVEGVWSDYSDAVIDIIRTYFRTRTEDIQIKSPAISKQPVGLRKEIMGELNVYAKDRDPTLRKEIMGELKENFAQDREHPSTLPRSDDPILLEQVKNLENRKVEFKKEIDLIKSSFKGQESENYTFINYHGQPLIEEEYEVLLELEKEVGTIPKWDYIFGESYKPNEKPWSFCYSVLGNHIVTLNIMNKSLTTLPKSINQLKFLHALDLRINDLTDLPESIGQLEYLEELSLQDNTLKSLPESIGDLTNLRVLHLENNDLTTLPDTICNLKTWAPIGLTNNKIGSLSEKILKHYSYAREYDLDLVGNPIMDTLKNKRNVLYKRRNVQETKLWRIRMREENEKKLKKLNL